LIIKAQLSLLPPDPDTSWQATEVDLMARSDSLQAIAGINNHTIKTKKAQGFNCLAPLSNISNLSGPINTK